MKYLIAVRQEVRNDLFKLQSLTIHIILLGICNDTWTTYNSLYHKLNKYPWDNIIFTN